MALWPWACDEQELSWCQLGDGDLGKDFSTGCEHVTNISDAHLERHGLRNAWIFKSMTTLKRRKNLWLMCNESLSTSEWAYAEFHIYTHTWWTFHPGGSEVIHSYLRQRVCKKTVQQPIRVLPLHCELSKRRQVDHSHLLHHQLVLSANWFKPVCALETGPWNWGGKNQSL